MTTVPHCTQETEVRLTGRDVWVIRLALGELLASATRHEHVYHDIHAALSKLPEAHEPHGPDCDCEAIAARGYGTYLARGCEPGRDVEDWLGAEMELRREAEAAQSREKAAKTQRSRQVARSQ